MKVTDGSQFYSHNTLTKHNHKQAHSDNNDDFGPVLQNISFRWASFKSSEVLSAKLRKMKPTDLSNLDTGQSFKSQPAQNRDPNVTFAKWFLKNGIYFLFWFIFYCLIVFVGKVAYFIFLKHSTQSI